MQNPQIIQSPKGEQMVVISKKEYDRLVKATGQDLSEDERDLAIASAQLGKIQKGQIKTTPHAIVKAILIKGDHPIKAWREFQGLTAEHLAKKAKIARSTIAMIETRKRHGTLEAYKSIAKALGVSVDLLIE